MATSETLVETLVAAALVQEHTGLVVASHKVEGRVAALRILHHRILQTPKRRAPLVRETRRTRSRR